MSRPPLQLIFLLIFLILSGQSHSSRFASISSSSDLVSDGVNDVQEPPFLRLNSMDSVSAPEESCEQSYGFLPCTTTALGNMFLILVYGYLMFLAAKYLSTGSELLLEILGPGIVGGLFLPALGALPDAMLILGNCCFFSMFSCFICFSFWWVCGENVWRNLMVCWEIAILF